MKAVVITQPGGPDVLQLQEVPEPYVKVGQVLIEVHVTALNRADLLQRQGNYPPPLDAPPYPGLECAGRVLQVGEGVTDWQPGQRVMALLSGGGYAERIAVAQETLMPIPEGMSYEEAAAIPEVWLTAYSNLIEIGRLQPGERVLVHAGGSGVGSAAIQLAKWRGASAIFSTASGGKLERVRELGADTVIDYREENFADRILDETDGEGVDIIVDFIGAPYWDDNLRALALWGRLVFIGLMAGRTVETNLGLFLSKKLSVHGSTLRDRTLEQKGRLVAAFTEQVLPAFSTDQLRPILDERRFHLEQIADAHRYMESNQNFGKIIVTIQDP
ncbi:MAG TPA: NAD(P)H-quinone oxidoreductase [Ardenticatenaceae bacterium]|jgi:putative PIG3 family NAD(P)H quinone oxidoreductase